MRVLLDTCVWGGTKDTLSLSGHDVIWAGDWTSDPGDAEILSLAKTERRVLITLDKDFGELAVVSRIAHCGIVRLVNIPARLQGKVCLRVLEKYGVELGKGSIVTCDEKRVRVRPPEISEPS
jgi:predicted nuclease of predicted toxin-antitoxin system